MDTETIAVKKSTDFTMFVPAFIDEYGFSPAQFRIFARIMRRSLGEGSQGCYETVQRLSLNLGISKRIVQESLKILHKANCISIIKRDGTSSLIQFQPCEKWVSKSAFDAIVYEVTGKRIQRDKERKMTPSGNATRSGNALPPSAETLHKGNPIKGIPLKNDSYESDDEPKTEATEIEAPNHPSSPKKDIRAAHPAILAVKDLMRRYPDKLLWDKIIKQFGEDFDFEKMRNCRVAWIEFGYNANSMKWLNWYTEGIPERRGAQPNSYTHVANQPTQREAIEAELRALEQ